MRTRLAVIALALLMCACVVAAEKPAMDIPAYPGGEATMEINLTDEDLLPTLKAMLPMMAGKMADKINFDDLDAALKDVKRVEALQVDIKKKVTDAEITDYYAKNVPAGEWSRVFWQNLPNIGTMAFYVAGGGEKLYGFRVQQAVVDEKPIKRVLIIKTEGKIDFAKALVIAGKVLL
jgi:hypothetical protein